MSSTLSKTPAPSTRLTSLDGLRGLAALIVVIHHSLLVMPGIADLRRPPAIGSTLWILQDTPLKLLTVGNEAVLVFFVLSGMVLVLPAIDKVGYDWIAYYPRRVLRLYLPVAASVAFAALCIAISAQNSRTMTSSWVAGASVDHPTWELFLRSLDVFQSGNAVNNPLWSLRWEMTFSLALPLFVAVAILARKRWAWVLGGTYVLVWQGIVTGSAVLQYLPVFLAGALLAGNAASLSVWAKRVRKSWITNLAWMAALLGGCTLLILHWLLWPVIADLPPVMQLADAASFPGALVIVAVGFLWQPMIRALMISPLRWLGRVSFGLYLVHVPIIIAVANLLPPGEWLWTAAIAIPVSLVVAELFTRFVDGPSHRLSRRVGDAISQRVAGHLARSHASPDAGSLVERETRDRLAEVPPRVGSIR